MMNCHYQSFLIDEIRFDLQDNIFYFPYLWETSYNRPLGRADRTFILGWHYMGLNADTGKARVPNGLLWGSTSGPACFIGLGSFLRPGEWSCEPYFSTLSVAPQPLGTVYVGKGCNVSHIGCNFHVYA